MKKTYSVIRRKDKSYVYTLNDGSNRLTFIYHFSTISETYMGMELKAFDDNWQFLKRNIHLLDIFHGEFEKEIKFLGYIQVEPTEVDKLLSE